MPGTILDMSRPEDLTKTNLNSFVSQLLFSGFELMGGFFLLGVAGLVER